MILRIEIDTFTKSGNKVHEFIESLDDKEGIKYTDFGEDYFLKDQEFEELEKQTIKKLEDKFDKLHKGEENNH